MKIEKLRLLLKQLNLQILKISCSKFKELILENNIKGIIFGLPLNMDGTEGPSAQSVKDKIKLYI